MKRFICLLISILLVLASGGVYGNYDGNSKEKGNYSNNLNYLRSQLKGSDKVQCKGFINQITCLKEKNKDKSTSIFINGAEYTGINAPVIKFKDIVIPQKAITEGLGAELKYDENTNIATITKAPITIELNLQKKVMKVNGVEIKSNDLKSSRGNQSLEIVKLISEILGLNTEIREGSGSIIVENADSISINDNVIGTGNNQFEYSANWSYDKLAGAYLEDNHFSVSENEFSQVRFTGMKIKLFATKGPGYGIAAISIDGKPEVSVDYYCSKVKNNTLIYASPTLDNGDHLLKIRVTGQKSRIASNYNVSVDRVEIISKSPNIPLPSPTAIPTATPSPTPVQALSKVWVNDNAVGNANKQFEYIGQWYSSSYDGSNFSDYHWTNSTDATTQIRFVGSQIKLFGTKDTVNGIFAVSIDGGAETNVDSYSNKKFESSVLYASPTLINGQHLLKVRVTGTKNENSSNTCIMLDKAQITYESSIINLALDKPAVASSSNDPARGPEKAFDGNAGTNWYSKYTNDEWIYVDLGTSQDIGRVKLKWEAAYGKMYRIQVSNDSVVWTDVYSTATGRGCTEDILIPTVSARYVKLSGIGRATQWGYSLREFEVYGS